MFATFVHSKGWILITVLCFVFVGSALGKECTLRVGAFQTESEGISGWGDRPEAEEMVESITATAINKTTKLKYSSYEVEDLRYFEKLPEGKYRIVLSKNGFVTSYEPYDLNCGNEPWHVATWYFRMWPGSPRTVKNNDPVAKSVKEMRLDRFTKLGSLDADSSRAPFPSISGGEAISLPEPRLSPRARTVDFRGFVKVRIFVDQLGKVTKATATSGPPLLLADCETAAYYSKFSPKIINGKPVSFFTVIDYPFGTPIIPDTVSGGVLNGKALSLPRPPYPPAARAVKASGAVSVKVLIDESGNVIEAAPVFGHPLLQKAAVQAAQAAKFSPVRIGEKPVKVSGVITYNFIP